MFGAFVYVGMSIPLSRETLCKSSIYSIAGQFGVFAATFVNSSPYLTSSQRRPIDS